MDITAAPLLDIDRRDLPKTLKFLAGFFVLSLGFYLFSPLEYHWQYIFRPATIEFISGRDPYSIRYFFNPPWTLLPLIPFAVLPAKVGSALISATTIFSYSYVLHRLGARWWAIALFLLVPQNIYTYINVNVEWLVMLGFIMPPQIGMFFVLVKPQAGAFLALWWTVEAWRSGGIKAVNRLVYPIAIASLLWIAIYGFRYSKYEFLATDGWSFWPYSIPIGIILMAAALKRRKAGMSILSAPLLAPYTAGHVWPLALVGLLPYQFEFIAGVIGLWFMWFVVPG